MLNDRTESQDMKLRAMRLLAEDIRRLRKANGLTLARLSEKLGRSVGWLSQVERGISLPTLADLRALAGQFKVPVTFFLQPEQENSEVMPGVVRNGLGRRLETRAPGVHRQLVSPHLGGNFTMLRTVFDPGASWKRPADRKEEDAGHVLSGTIELTHGERRNTLETGDSFTVSDGEAVWHNKGPSPASILWITAPAAC